jgi:adenosylcobinamide-phosphate synthase
VALWVDRVCGEPPAWAHPVVAMGRYLGALGPIMVTWSAPLAFLGGALAWCVGALLVTALALALQLGLKAQWLMGSDVMPAIGGSVAPQVGLLLQGLFLGLLLKPMMAKRMLLDEVRQVEIKLSDSLASGREQLKRLVSRDVSELNEAQVRESAIESLAENLNDSVVAPLFWFALGGVPAAVLYRFANTADAMWGYRGRHEWVGKWAARADDALNWVPARITALLLCMAAGRWFGLGVIREQAVRTPSPNGGWPMGVMALLLGVRLGKPDVYTLNSCGRAAQVSDTWQALVWADQAVWWLALVLSACLMLVGFVA